MTVRIAAAFALSLAFAGAFAGGGFAQTRRAPRPPSRCRCRRQSRRSRKTKCRPRLLFSKAKLPSLGHAMAIGYYPRGCLQGGVELPVDGPNWQVMRLSRNRNWGHPELVKFLERFAPLAAKATGWQGILVGDMAQPRGGPLPFGHASHQIGLDVDIWFMPMPNHELSKKERENISASNLVAADGCTSIRKPGRRPTSPSSRPRPSSPRSSAFWSMPRSRRNCAASRTSNMTAGWRRCGPGTATPTTSTCG